MSIRNHIKRYVSHSYGVAAIETAFIFPILMTMMFGIIDVGTAVIINTKVITASQISSDLLTRDNSISDAEMTEARRAAEAALIPYFDATEFGIDVAGVRFIGEDAVPTEQWRDTFNMSANTNAVADTAGLGDEGDGVLIVTVEYKYTPRFSGFLTGDIEMREVSVARGRDNAFVDRN